MPPPPLGALCRKTAVAHIDELAYVSDLPYHMVRGILAHVRHGQQLKEIEEASPQIKNEDGELWEALTKKKFLVQLKKMKKLNNDHDLEIACWRGFYWKLQKEDGELSAWFLSCFQNMAHADLDPADEREAQALAHLEKTLTTINKNKGQVKANLADPRRLPKRPKDTTSNHFAFSHLPDKYFGNSIKDTPFQKVKKEADKVINNRQLAIKARMTPTKALSTVPKGLTEAMRIRRQPLIPMRSDKRVDITDDSERTQREYEERQKREERLLAAQKPKKAPTNNGIHLPGTNIPNSLQKVLDDNCRPATTPPPKVVTQVPRKSTNSLLTCPPDIQKAHSRIKLVPSTTLRVSTSNTSTNGLKTRPGSSHGLPGSTSSPSGKSATTTDADTDDDDLFGEKQTTPTKPTKPTPPGSPNKRPFSMVTGSTDNNISSTTGPTSPGSQPPRKKMKKTTGIFMPAKRAR